MGDEVYMRMAWGQCIIQRVPRVMSEKRRKACEEFGRRFGTNRKKIDNGSYTDGTQCSVNGPLEDRGEEVSWRDG